MASPLFCHRLLNDPSLEPLLGIHFLEATALVLQLAQPSHQRGVHATEFGAPLVEAHRADAMFAAQLRDWTADFGLLEDTMISLAEKTRCLHAKFP